MSAVEFVPVTPEIAAAWAIVKKARRDTELAIARFEVRLGKPWYGSTWVSSESDRHRIADADRRMVDME